MDAFYSTQSDPYYRILSEVESAETQKEAAAAFALCRELLQQLSSEDRKRVMQDIDKIIKDKPVSEDAGFAQARRLTPGGSLHSREQRLRFRSREKPPDHALGNFLDEAGGEFVRLDEVVRQSSQGRSHSGINERHPEMKHD